MAKWVVKTPADYERARRAIQDKIDKATKGAEGATLKALTDVAVDLLSRAAERAPVETGDLRGSGYININGEDIAYSAVGSGGIIMAGTPAPSESKKNVAEVGFTAPYAFTQHEHVEFNHPIGGQAKYLESVVVERKEMWAKQLADSARDGFKGGG
ncbi:MAG: hypothetical protein ACM3S4_04860 [Burkholderiales bacterium]